MGLIYSSTENWAVFLMPFEVFLVLWVLYMARLPGFMALGCTKNQKTSKGIKNLRWGTQLAFHQ